MGHMTQQRQLSSSRQERFYDSYSLGRSTPAGGGSNGVSPGQVNPGSPGIPANTQSLTHLADIGRSRSDLGYTQGRNENFQSRVSLHTGSPGENFPPVSSPRGSVTPSTSPRGSVPPSSSPRGPSSSPRGSIPAMNVPTPTSPHTMISPTRPKKPPRLLQYPVTPPDPPLPPSQDTPGHVENTEYYALPDQASTSHYALPEQVSTSPRTRRRAVVLCQYRRKSMSEVSLTKNSVVGVLEGQQSSEWWRVETQQGVQGFYPANFLRQIQ